MSPAEPRIVRDRISRAQLHTLAAARFGDMVKAVEEDEHIRAAIREVVAGLVSDE